MIAATSRALWYADGLRWIGSLLVSAADHLAQRSAEAESAEPWPDLFPPHERVTELRNRAHCY